MPEVPAAETSSRSMLWTFDGSDQNLGNNVGTIAPNYRVKRWSRADQRARRVNNLASPAQSANLASPVRIRTAPPFFL